MIGKISGILEYRSLDHFLIDVRGVGYVVYVDNRVMAGLPGIGEAVALYTDLLVREDNLQLFGFTTLVEKEWHRLLMSVQGIGAKASLAILGTLGADGVSRAIALGDWSAIAKAKGAPAPVANPAQGEALSALGNLGYGPGDAAGAVAQAMGEQPDLDTSGLIRAALKLLAPKG